MNGYELVDYWVKEEKRTHISTNEITRNGTDGEVALVILKRDYNARYQESYDPRSCGDWCFDNPFHEKVPAIELRYCFRHRSEWETSAVYEGSIRNFKDLFHPAEEIMRLDGGREGDRLYFKGTAEEKQRFCAPICETLLRDGMYIGQERYWMVIPTETYK